ncbi:hypothetical protein RsTz2092_13860 [Deferribacterales bacterium RsTz2092]|nr:hypothetical protein AGMMS49941_13390 [Deferribacterales bacterium]
MKKVLGLLFIFVLLASVAPAQQKTYVLGEDAFPVRLEGNIFRFFDSEGRAINGIVQINLDGGRSMIRLLSLRGNK